MGEWKFEEKESQSELIYKGEWQNGIWHGLGDFYEASLINNTKISVDISKGRFINGELLNYY